MMNTSTPKYLGGVLASTEGRRIRWHVGDDGWLRKNPLQKLNGKKARIALDISDKVMKLDFGYGVMSKAA